MAMIDRHGWCAYCGKYVLQRRKSFSNGWGCGLTILTGGLFLPVWIVLKILEAVKESWRCQACGMASRF